MDERSKKQQSSLEKEIGKHESQGISAGIIELYVYINIHIYIYKYVYVYEYVYIYTHSEGNISYFRDIFMGWDNDG